MGEGGEGEGWRSASTWPGFRENQSSKASRSSSLTKSASCWSSLTAVWLEEHFTSSLLPAQCRSRFRVYQPGKGREIRTKTQSTPTWSSSNKSDGRARAPTLSSGGMEGMRLLSLETT